MTGDRRGIYHGSYKFFHAWSVGVLILFSAIATAFIGYVLPPRPLKTIINRTETATFEMYEETRRLILRRDRNWPTDGLHIDSIMIVWIHANSSTVSNL